VVVDGTTLTPRQQILSTPSAARAITASHANVATALATGFGQPAGVFLDAAGDMRVTGGANNVAEIRFDGSASGSFAITSLQGARMHMLDSGFVGMGTSTPTHPLHVAYPVPALALQDNDSTSGQVGWVSYRDSGNVERAWVGYGTATDPTFSVVNARTAGDILLFPGSGGGVGIGVNAGDNFLLDVAGSIRCTFLTQTSSAAFKDDVAPLAQRLDELLALAPVSYRWNDKAPEAVRGEPAIGLIAEDVAKVLPDAVTCDAEGKPVGIDYSRITVLAVKAIQEQQAANAKLRERLERLEAALLAQAK
jgi:hypothetical protein